MLKLPVRMARLAGRAHQRIAPALFPPDTLHDSDHVDPKMRFDMSYTQQVLSMGRVTMELNPYRRAIPLSQMSRPRMALSL